MIRMEITNRELIKKAKSVLKPVEIKPGIVTGDVGCALISDKSNIYLGTCVTVDCGMGLCAEQSAIANMITNNEYKIKKIVAVSKYGVIPPCGKCREFIKQINRENLDAEVIINENKIVKLKELLPYLWDEKE